MSVFYTFSLSFGCQRFVSFDNKLWLFDKIYYAFRNSCFHFSALWYRWCMTWRHNRKPNKKKNGRFVFELKKTSAFHGWMHRWHRQKLVFFVAYLLSFFSSTSKEKTVKSIDNFDLLVRLFLLLICCVCIAFSFLTRTRCTSRAIVTMIMTRVKLRLEFRWLEGEFCSFLFDAEGHFVGSEFVVEKTESNSKSKRWNKLRRLIQTDSKERIWQISKIFLASRNFPFTL